MIARMAIATGFLITMAGPAAAGPGSAAQNRPDARGPELRDLRRLYYMARCDPDPGTRRKADHTFFRALLHDVAEYQSARATKLVGVLTAAVGGGLSVVVGSGAVLRAKNILTGTVHDETAYGIGVGLLVNAVVSAIVGITLGSMGSGWAKRIKRREVARFEARISTQRRGVVADWAF